MKNDDRPSKCSLQQSRESGTIDASHSPESARLQRLNDILRANWNISQQLSSTEDEDAVLESVCSTLIDRGVYEHVWILLLGTSGKPDTFYGRGTSDAYKELEQVVRNGHSPACALKALSAPEAVIELEHGCEDCPIELLKKPCRIWVSAITCQGIDYGVLATLAADNLDADAAEEKELIRGVATDVASALHRIAARRERELARKKLRESERRFSLLSGSLNGMVYTCKYDAFWTVEHASQGCLKLTGYTPEELLHNNSIALAEVILQEDREKVRAAVEAAVSRGRPYDIQYRIVRKDGARRWVWEQGAAVVEEDGELLLEGFITDVTQRVEHMVKLQEARDFYLHVLDDLPAPTFRINAQRECDYVNKAWTAFSGWSLDELPHTDWREIIHPEDLAQMAAVFEEAYARLDGYEREYRLKLADGSYAPLVEHGRPMMAEDGTFIGYVCSCFDMRSRKETERELRASEHLYRATISASPLAINVLSPEGEVLSWNKAAQDIFGWSERELLGQRTPVVPPEREEEFQEHVRQNKLGAAIHAKETVRARKDGSLVEVNLYTAPILEADGLFRAVVAIYEDITERKARERETREQRELLTAILDNVPIMVAFIDTTGELSWVNRCWEDTLGWPLEEMRKTNFLAELYPDPEERAKVVDFIRRSDGVWGDFKPRIRSGESLATRWVNVALSDGSVIAIGIDITAQTQAAAKEQELTDRLEHSQRLESVGRLAGGVAHDLNNMLAPILGYAELSLDDVHDPTVRESLQEIQRAAVHARDLVRQLLAFGRKQVLEVKTLRVSDVVSRMFGILKRVMPDDVEIDLNLVAEGGWVKADPTQIEQIMLNLCINAADAMPGGGKLSIETAEVNLDEEYLAAHPEAQVGPHVMLAISDTGTGMTEEIQHTIFDPFFTTKKEGEGTGLGLATVYGIVKQHGGNIWVYSELGQGTTFKIYLPAEYHETPVSPTEQETGVSRAAGARVLVLEDETAVLKLAVRILEKEGYTVVSASRPYDALEKARELEHIDLLITDVVMPQMKGPEVHEQLQKLFPNIQVLYMSGYTANVITNRGVLKEGIQFVQKPFSVAEFMQRVRETLPQRREASRP